MRRAADWLKAPPAPQMASMLVRFRSRPLGFVFVVACPGAIVALLFLPTTRAAFSSTTDSTSNVVAADTLEPPTGLVATGGTQWLLERRKNPLCRFRGIAGPCNVLQQDPKLVGSEAGNRVLGPALIAEQAGHRSQQVIARSVAERVVDLLEVVQI